MSNEAKLSRILLCSNTAWSMYNFRLGLMRELMSQGIGIEVAAKRDHTAAKMEALGIKFSELQLERKGVNPFQDLALFRSLKKLYLQRAPDLVIHYTIKPNIFGSFAARAAGVRSWAITTGLGYTFHSTGLLNWIVRFLYRTSLKNVDRVFFLNSDDLNEFVRGGLIKESQATLLPGEGVDMTHFAPLPMPVDEQPCFLLITRMLQEKGIREFVEAARIVKKRVPGARFQLLGAIDRGNPGAITKEEMDGWSQAGLVEYLGVTTDVRPYIAQAHCVVLPSYYREGLPRVLLEAASCGRPIITTRHPGCAELVDEGVTGYLCKPRDAGDLAEKMLQMVELPASAKEAMGLRGRELISRRYSEQAVIESYLRLLGQPADKTA